MKIRGNFFTLLYGTESGTLSGTGLCFIIHDASGDCKGFRKTIFVRDLFLYNFADKENVIKKNLTVITRNDILKIQRERIRRLPERVDTDEKM